MNRFINLLFAMACAGVITLGFSETVQAAQSTSQALATCRGVAERVYGNGHENAEIHLDGVRKSGRQLRLRVHTPNGEMLTAFCTVNRRTGELVSLDPPGRQEVAERTLSSVEH